MKLKHKHKILILSVLNVLAGIFLLCLGGQQFCKIFYWWRYAAGIILVLGGGGWLFFGLMGLVHWRK
jgi:hypothetical protein